MAPRLPQASLARGPTLPSLSAAPSVASPLRQLPTPAEEIKTAGLTIQPLVHAPLGAEVLGLDLMHNPITPSLVSGVREALLSHQVRTPDPPRPRGGKESAPCALGKDALGLPLCFALFPPLSHPPTYPTATHTT